MKRKKMIIPHLMYFMASSYLSVEINRNENKAKLNPEVIKIDGNKIFFVFMFWLYMRSFIEMKTDPSSILGSVLLLILHKSNYLSVLQFGNLNRSTRLKVTRSNLFLLRQQLLILQLITLHHQDQL